MMIGNIVSWRFIKYVWNLVEIDGKWYYVDIIFDRVDLIKGKVKDRSDVGKIIYNYFLMYD